MRDLDCDGCRYYEGQTNQYDQWRIRCGALGIAGTVLRSPPYPGKCNLKKEGAPCRD